MTALQLTTLVLSAAYGALMVAYRVGWRKQQRIAHTSAAEKSNVKFSIIIPARNEAKNIGALLDSIFAQRYPKDSFEVIVVDDHSTDGTAAVAESSAQPGLTMLRLSEHIQPGERLNAAKKRALALGIEHAKFPHVVTTDADCIVPPDWLVHLAGGLGRNSVFAAAPVDFLKSSGVLYHFQSLDFMAMQGITAAANALSLGTMSNGANLVFSRTAFDEVGGYNQIDHLASGDDYLLTRKLAVRFGNESLNYILHPGAIVCTAAQPTWSDFLQQRIRWASKSGKYQDPRLTAILILVYVMNVWLVALAFAAFFAPGAAVLLLTSLVAKIILELVFLWPVASFFGKRSELLIFPLLQPLHVLYIVLAGFLGMRGGYQWKGRDVR